MGILEFHNVSKGYGDTPVLRNLSFDVQEGQFLAILGLLFACGWISLLFSPKL